MFEAGSTLAGQKYPVGQEVGFALSGGQNPPRRQGIGSTLPEGQNVFDGQGKKQR